MAKHLMLVLSNARDGREDEFGRWYDQHMRDTIDKLDGFTCAQRFELADLPGAPEPPYRYLALYEVEDDRLVPSRRIAGDAGFVTGATIPVNGGQTAK
jgi:hypothetical protein